MQNLTFYKMKYANFCCFNILIMTVLDKQQAIFDYPIQKIYKLEGSWKKGTQILNVFSQKYANYKCF